MTTPAKPGETIILVGTGFGPTEPAIPAGQVADPIGYVTAPLTIRLGGLPAEVSFAGIGPGFASLYQFNVTVPATLAAGDHALVAEIGGASSPSGAACCFITVQP